MVHVWQNQVIYKTCILNGRIDLSQAEAVMDFIRSKTDRASKVAMNQIEGRLSDLIKKQRQSILEILAQVEVNIDYPEYDDVEDATTDFLLEQSKVLKKKSISYLKQEHKVK